MSLCLISIFKNESHIFEEWIQHYIHQGVDKLYLIDNNSDDNYLKILQPYIDTNVIELIVDTRSQIQVDAYNRHFLDKSKEYDWCMVVDLDEFVYARKGFKTIKEYLSTLDDSISQIFIPWKIFGSNKYKEQPQSIIKSFTKRTNYDKPSGCQGVVYHNDYKYSLIKCIVKTKYLKHFNIHSHITTNNNYISSDNRNDNLHPTMKEFSKIDEQILENSFLHLNHYVIQSYNWFMNVKVKRGCATTIYNPRTETYFLGFDNCSNDIDDFELSKL